MDIKYQKWVTRSRQLRYTRPGGVVYWNGISGWTSKPLENHGVQPGWTATRDKDFTVFTAESQEPARWVPHADARGVEVWPAVYVRLFAEADFKGSPNRALRWWKHSGLSSNMSGMLGYFFRAGQGDRLRGLFGGDGDFAREELAFGFMVENDYHHVYRIWSRAWLVTS